jgi:hypothetical protein
MEDERLVVVQRHAYLFAPMAAIGQTLSGLQLCGQHCEAVRLLGVGGGGDGRTPLAGESKRTLGESEKST